MFLQRLIIIHFLTFCMLVLTLFSANNSHAETWDIKQLMQTLADVKPNHASFIEKKFIAVLDKPVVSSGELFFEAPDYLEKRTIVPKAESLIVKGDRLLIERGNKTYYFQVNSYPELSVFINSIRGTLAGDLASLKSNFEMGLEGTPDKWTLQLVPINKKMRSQLQHIRIAGFNNQVRSIEISQADGDSSYMTIEPLDGRP